MAIILDDINILEDSEIPYKEDVVEEPPKSIVSSAETGHANTWIGKLAKLIENEDDTIISCDGCRMIIRDMNVFKYNVFPKYFYTTTYFSFLRQLNNYGSFKDKGSCIHP